MESENLSARLARTEARLAAAERDLAHLRRQSRRRAGGARAIALLVAACLALVPASLWASDRFTDVPASNPHHNDIGLIADANITLGCVANLRYCPKDYVTREQMASFLARTAGLGINAPVVNAKQLQGRQANEMIRVARGQFIAINQSPAVAPIALTTSYQPMVTLTIHAPAAGFILLAGDITARNASSGSCYCVVDATIYHVEGNQAESAARFSLPTAGNSYGAAGLTRVFGVEPGVNTFQIQAQKISDESGQPIGNANVYIAEISAVYSPFGSQGNSGAGIDSVP